MKYDYLVVNSGLYGAVADKVVYTGPIDACFDYRLGEYKYYDMDQVIAAAFDMWDKEIRS